MQCKKDKNKFLQRSFTLLLTTKTTIIMANVVSEKQKQFNDELYAAFDEIDTARKEFAKALDSYEKSLNKVRDTLNHLSFKAVNDDEYNRICISVAMQHKMEVEGILKKFNGIRCEMA